MSYMEAVILPKLAQPQQCNDAKSDNLKRIFESAQAVEQTITITSDVSKGLLFFFPRMITERRARGMKDGLNPRFRSHKVVRNQLRMHPELANADIIVYDLATGDVSAFHLEAGLDVRFEKSGALYNRSLCEVGPEMVFELVTNRLVGLSY